MAKYALKTKVTDASVTAFLDAVEPEQKRLDAFEILDIMKEVNGDEPKCGDQASLALGLTIMYMKVVRKAILWPRDSHQEKQNIRCISLEELKINLNSLPN